MQYLEFRAMNSDIILAAEGLPNKIESGFQVARSYIEYSERRFSRFASDSELSRLNRAAGAWFEASPELFELVRLSREFYEGTGGLFDPSILPDLKRAGYDRSMDEIRAKGASGDPEIDTGGRAAFNEVRLDREGGKISRGKSGRDKTSSGEIYLPSGMEIDLGGIAKGWIAERAAGILSDYATACAVSAGGDMVLVGEPEGGTGWEVALEDPRDPEAELAVLKVSPGALATSSITKRRWQRSGKSLHHLIDPRNGEPAVTEWLSVTVAAPHAAEAEVLAKALLIAGPEDGMALLSKNEDVGFIAVDREGKLFGKQTGLELSYDRR
jgi:thiamine biosynthesis lipoprotein